jgi:hypothetical protein
MRELLYIRPYRLEGALIYVCTAQQSGQWLIGVTDNDRLKSVAKLEATDVKNLFKSVNVAFRARDKLAQS